MWKTRTKLSKLLTNIHAGFVTALLGCVLTFAPLSAMAEITFTRGTCTKLSDTYMGSYTNLSANAQVCRNSEVIYFQTSLGAVYRHSSCVCGTNETPVYASANIRQYCGNNSELIYVTKCNTSSGGTTTTNCTPTNYFGTDTPVNSAELLNCNVILKQKFGGVVVGSCTTCAGSMSRESRTHKVDGCSNLYEFETCPCTTAAQCGNGTTSTVNNMNITYSANCITATKKCTAKTPTSCKCVKNYYGNVSVSSGSCTGTCTACPPDPKNGIAGETSSNGATAITSCYIPSGKPFTTDIGTGTYSGACYY